uniref:C2H2-type domain-containing protein n=1 Tax=Meloidogyne hapla TaxID=6305 RepID=A0A1I8BMZ9_MELHA
MYPPPSWKPPGAKSAKKTVSAKIRTLSDFHSRILNQQQIPSSAEMVTTLRYFQQTLVSQKSSALHTLIIERLAYHLPDLYSDLLTVIASGTSESRIAAGCSSSSRIAIGTCFDEDCIRSHGYEPLRLCEECFNALHSIENNRAHEHIRHSGHAFVWGTHYERVMVEAIVKLLRETSSKLTELSADGESAKRPKWLRQLEGGRELGREIDPLSDERRMLSRFGIWLMVAHCPPVPEATPCSVGYLLGALFQWFSTTALLPNDAMGQTLEQLKADFGCEWLNQALSNHYEVFINELLPQQLEPLDGTIEDTIWDERFVRKEIMRDGLSKLLALAPYDIISIDTWSRVMPHWLHSLNTDLVSEDDLLELKVPISKLFEPDLCALPFEPQRLYEFLAIRLQSNSYEEILKALDWLHVSI